MGDACSAIGDENSLSLLCRSGDAPVIEICSTDQGQEQLNPLSRYPVSKCSLAGSKGLVNKFFRTPRYILFWPA